jgi:hypothetical protein
MTQDTLPTYSCTVCGHTAPNYPTSGYVDERGAHHAEDSEQAHARFHAEVAEMGLDAAAFGYGA